MQSVLLLLFNSQGEILLQRRSLSDDSYPGRWDFSAGGGLEQGEDPKLGLIREAKEEINVQIDPVAFADVDFPEDYLHIFTYIYDGDFLPNPAEVMELKFFTKTEARELLSQMDLLHPELTFVLNKFPKILD